MLAPYAARVENSRGRRHAEPSHPYRNDFERDRDRIVHARAFRRLNDKTQVFTRRYSDHFRNRLTHTLEVTQIARTIAAQLELNVDLVEALALAHDLGHPPFGHAGEKALDSVMREHDSFFDHNLHALRIVEDFEQRYASFPGLNLTFEVREGIIKHSRNYNPEEFRELADYCLDQQPPLEAQLIDLADEIAYSTADLDDGFEAHILGLDQVRDGVGIFDRGYRQIEPLFPQAIAKLKFNEALKRMVNRLVGDLIHNTQAKIAAADVRTIDDVRLQPARLVAFSPEVESDRRQAKEFLYQNLYFSEELQPEKEDAEQIIGELFNYWLQNPGSLPTAYQEKARRESLPRVVCDYIAGMTDTFIQHQYESMKKQKL